MLLLFTANLTVVCFPEATIVTSSVVTNRVKCDRSLANDDFWETHPWLKQTEIRSQLISCESR